MNPDSINIPRPRPLVSGTEPPFEEGRLVCPTAVVLSPTRGLWSTTENLRSERSAGAVLDGGYPGGYFTVPTAYYAVPDFRVLYRVLCSTRNRYYMQYPKWVL